MEWIDQIQNAVDYIEAHLEEKIDYAEVAARAYVSSYHFQRMFAFLCGMSLGEYIRRRRLSRAGKDLLDGNKVLDVAVKYGYESSESFSRAFQRFHGVLPSQVKRGASAKYFQRISLNLQSEGEGRVNCTVEERPAKTLVGFRKRFCGVPYGAERLRQEDEFYRTTRGKQWLLLGAASDRETEYVVVTNVGDDGYDFYIAYELDDWTRKALFDRAVTGMDLEQAGFEIVDLPKRICAVFPTEKLKYPISEYVDIRQRVALEWLPRSDYQLAEAPEVVELHWRTGERYIEITLPIM